MLVACQQAAKQPVFQLLHPMWTVFAPHPPPASVPTDPLCRETGESKVILTALCGHGFLDLPAYDVYMHGNLKVIS